MPFGFHLAMDTLPSRELRKSCPTLSGQRGITPTFGYGAPHPGARGTLTLLNNVLLSTHYGRSDSCPPGSSACLRHELRLLHGQVSLIHALRLPPIPSPTTGARSVSPRHVTSRRIESRRLPHGTPPCGNSRLRLSLATSPLVTGRIEFLIVRTGRSPSVALHPVSRRRSYLGLPSYVDSKRTFTSPTECALRRTNAGARSRFSAPRLVAAIC
jgi:hypothetical protein